MECPYMIKTALSPKKYLKTYAALSRKIRKNAVYPGNRHTQLDFKKIISNLGAFSKYEKMNMSKARAASGYINKVHPEYRNPGFEVAKKILGLPKK